MSSLYNNMSQGGASYGTVPGNGNPRADDKNMNVGPGHVVPAENAHIAKKIVERLGYDPNVKVDMNQGINHADESIPIKISSKEFFLNEEQVQQMKNMGIDPESLSPNSDYNERVNGGTTKQVNSMVDEQLNMFDLMSNNNNQYPAYEDGGLTQPYQRPDLSMYPYSQALNPEGQEPSMNWYDNQGRLTYSEVGSDGNRVDNTGKTESDWAYHVSEGYVPELDVNNLPQGIEISGNPQAQTPGGESMSLPTRPAQEIQGGVSSQNMPLADPSAGASTAPVAPEAPNTAPDGISPEDQHLKDLMKRSQDLENQEVAANAAMGLWNMSRERQPLPEPVYMSPGLIRRDYETMKNELRSDVDRSERKNQNIVRELGMDPTKMVGITASGQEANRKGKRSIWEMQQADTAHNVGTENQLKSRYQDQKFQRDMMDAESAGNFAREKGQNMAGNVREIFDAKEAGLYRTGELEGVQANKKMDNLDAKYNKLDVQKMRDMNMKFINRTDYYNMSDQQREELDKKLQGF